jgi:hypothetical protein
MIKKAKSRDMPGLSRVRDAVAFEACGCLTSVKDEKYSRSLPMEKKKGKVHYPAGTARDVTKCLEIRHEDVNT